jgi:hypothetical protein
MLRHITDYRMAQRKQRSVLRPTKLLQARNLATWLRQKELLDRKQKAPWVGGSKNMSCRVRFTPPSHSDSCPKHLSSGTWFMLGHGTAGQLENQPAYSIQSRQPYSSAEEPSSLEVPSRIPC